MSYIFEFDLELSRGIMLQEENNTLKIQNEQLDAKLRRANKFISRVQEYIPRLRASTGSNEYIDFDGEERLRKMLKVSFLSNMLYIKSLKNGCLNIE